jgi:hypothetical protein
MKEFLATVRQQVEQRSVSIELPTARVSVAASPGMVITGTIDVTMRKVQVAAVGVVGAATDTLTVEKETPSDLGMPLDAKVFLAVLWALTIALILWVDQLPEDVHDKIMDFLALVNFSLMIHWRVTDGHKRD